jgi:FtsP/CotA-like multicopper oxidase with cupredoxin domain
MVSMQVPMGLYGPVIVEAAAGEAYTGITYGNEAILFYSEIDPAVNNAGVPASADYRPQYFLVNGESYPTAVPEYATPPAAGEDLLVRFFNAGLETSMPMLDGVLMQVVAEDGNVTPGGSVYPATPAAYSLLLPAGKTIDAMIAAVPDGKYAVIDRTLRLDNGPGVDDDGGQLVFLDYAPAP